MSDAPVQGVPESVRRALATGKSLAISDAIANLSIEDRHLLEIYLGRDAVERMRRRARRGRGRRLGRVVLTHGILGSELSSVDAKGDADWIWVNLLRLSMGRIRDLTMNGGGARPTIRVDGLRVEYLPLLIELTSQWEVLPFAYDWRENIDTSAARLDAAIGEWAAGEPAHLIAHSMGGLVSRRFIQKFPQRWVAMNDGRGRGGRLVMLGTPNFGSFAVPLMLTGTERLVKWLEVIDVRHDMGELLAIIDSFPGSYQMLPSPDLDFGDDRAKLYQSSAWGALPVTQRLLDLGSTFQKEIADVVDPARMIYVAGYDQKTPYRIRVQSAGKFAYQETFDGDGRVPHEIGLLKGVRTFWLKEVHGDLPRHARLLEGIHDLLLTGQTDQLETERPRSRAVPVSGEPWKTGEELFPMPKEAESFALKRSTRAGGAARAAVTPDEAARIEAMILSDYLGGPRTRGARVPPATPPRAPQAPVPKLRIEVLCGDITLADADVYAVGHYMGVEPQFAELALDRAVSGFKAGDEVDPSKLVITKLTRRGVIKGELGDIYFVPWSRPGGKSAVVAVAGMGRTGRFGRPQLVRLAESLTNAVSSLPHARTVCTVLIGSGTGNLRTSVALEGLLQGVAEALQNTVVTTTIETVRVVEKHYGRACEIHDSLRKLQQGASEGQRVLPIQFDVAPRLVRAPGASLGRDFALALALSALSRASTVNNLRKAIASVVQSTGIGTRFEEQIQRELEQLSSGHKGSALELAKRFEVNLKPEPNRVNVQPTRLTVSREGPNILSASLSDTAVVPERASGVDPYLIDEAVEGMVDPDHALIPDLGRTLNRLILPRDFREILREADSAVIFEVDRAMAKVHWEMIARDPMRLDDNADALALHVSVARQLRTAYSAPPAPDTDRRGRVRALVIGDPGDPQEDADLPGARREALQIATLLEELGVEVRLMIGAPGSAQEQFKGERVQYASRLGALRELMTCGYDLLHYAGHGGFDSRDPVFRSGWLFKGGLLTARELERVDLAPRLVVANACLSARTSDKSGGSRASLGLDADLLPGLADEFFRRGVRNYVGTAWEIDDLGAILFAEILYAALLGQRQSLGDAMLAARRQLKEREAEYGALWAAYQHYGNPHFTFG